jgi:hypothetical protein
MQDEFIAGDFREVEQRTVADPDSRRFELMSKLFTAHREGKISRQQLKQQIFALPSSLIYHAHVR